MSIIKRKAGSEDIVKSILEFDAVPTEGSPNLVDSGTVAQAIGENSNVALFKFTGTDYPDGDAVLAEQEKGKTVVLVKYVSGYGGFWYDYYYLVRRVAGNIGVVSATYLEFYPVDNSKKYIKAFKDLDAAEPAWVWSQEDTNVTNTIGNVETLLAAL